MNRSRRLWMWAFSLVMPLLSVCVAKGDDFLFVLATPSGQRSEIHWIPADAPLAARVLLEDLDQTEFIHRHRDELWWWMEEHPVMGNLVGQVGDTLSEFGGPRVSDIVRQGDKLYWITNSQLGSFDLQTGHRQVLAVSNSLVQTAVPVQTEGTFVNLFVLEDGGFVFGNGGPGLRGLAIYEDRLYFGDGSTLESIRLDGADRRQLSTRDPGTGSLQFPLTLGPGTEFPLVVGGGPRPRGLAVHDDQLVWVKDEAFWQIDLRTGEESQLSGDLPESVSAMSVTDEAIYWIDGRKVWRWKHGADEHETFYELGDTSFHAITVVSADPRPTVMWDKERIGVVAEGEGSYQLLFSEDLRSWSPDIVRRSLFSGTGFLSWLSPRAGEDGEALVWHPQLTTTREAYFAAWQYDLGVPFDHDGDELPDYWERRHFNDLSAVPDGDTNGDGIVHLEEASLFIGPKKIDADEDGLSNAEELAHEPPLNPALNDTDGDTLTDGDEVNVYHSDPHSDDTDSDGFTDDFELTFGGDLNTSEIVPSGEDVLVAYADDLVVHLDFESSDNATIPNRGGLGGVGTIVGEESYVTRVTETGETSRAINFVSDPDDPASFSYLETAYRLDEIGFAREGTAFTIALWLRADHPHRGTLLSAAQFSGSEPAMSFQVRNQSGNDLLSLRLFLNSLSRSSSATAHDAVHARSWTHVVWREGPDGRAIYVNGRLLSTRVDDIGFMDGGDKLWLGAQRGLSDATLPFRGAMDDVRIYRRALPENAIRVLAR